MNLSELGDRICILSPSNSGKSTLADAIARKRNLEAVYLDQLFHLPNRDWEQRPRPEFIALHNAAIERERWVMDGNYAFCMPQRFRRATGLIVLDVSTITSLLRYFRRTLFEKERRGALAGGRDSVKWDMIHHITVATPKNRDRYRAIFEEFGAAKVQLSSLRAIKECFQQWDLTR